MARTPLLSRLSQLARTRSAPSSEPRLSRRDLVKLGLAAASVPTLGAGCRGNLDGRTVVIGGGIAGLHCAYRLQQGGVDVVLYEASDRVGGRMWTGRNLFGSGQLCEIGGELVDTNHLTLWELADEFGIALDDRSASMRPTTVLDTWWAGGRAVPEDEIVAQYTEVAPTIAAAFDSAETTDDGYATLDATPLDVFLADACPPGQFPELHAVLTSAYRGEFGLEVDEQSCLNLVYLIDSTTPDPFRIFGDSDERYHTHDGNDVFPSALAEGMTGGTIKLRHVLKAVRDRKGGGYEIDVVGPDGDTFTDEADHVVFALPFTKLREVTLDCEDLSPLKRRIVDELGMGTNAKVMGGFTRRVWFEDHDASGSATADLGFQQCWDTSVGQAGAAGLLTNFLGGDQGVASGDGEAVDWFAGILPDLEQLWPGTTAAFDGTAVRMHWPTHEWTRGSYTCYLPGQWAFWSLEGRRQGNLHFCGEHTSLDFQGWMEGGAETGALVAAEILDDHGREKSARHAAIVAAKTLAPQACYHGDLLPASMRPRRRRAELVRRVRELLASGAHRA